MYICIYVNFILFITLGVGGTGRFNTQKVDGAPALWAEKYRPLDVEHLVGNADHVKRLLSWVVSTFILINIYSG